MNYTFKTHSTTTTMGLHPSNTYKYTLYRNETIETSLHVHELSISEIEPCRRAQDNQSAFRHDQTMYRSFITDQKI